MKNIIASVALALLAPLAHAGTSSVVIAVGYDPNVPAARLEVRADYVAVPVSIENDTKDPIKRAEEVRNAMRMISDAIAKLPDLTLKPGRISLSARPGPDSSFGKFMSYGTPASTAELYVLGALKPGADVFAVTKRIWQAIGGIAFGEGTRAGLGNTSLGLNDPEKYRPQLLALLPRAIAEARKTLGVSASFDIGGLQNPVSVMQLNESEVVLFISYTLRAQTKAM